MLSKQPLEKLFSWVSENSFSGVLALANEEIKKSIVFENGRPVAARSNVKSEALGSLLVGKGLITSEQLSQSLEMLKGKEARHQGEALLTMGIIDYNALNDALREQLLIRLYEVFTWPEGRYALLSEIPEDTVRVSVDLTLSEVSLRGLMEKYSASPEAADLKLELKPVPVGGQSHDLSKFRFKGREMAFFRGINGVNDLAQIIEKSRMDEGSARAMILALKDLDLVDLGQRSDRAPDSPPKRRSRRQTETSQTPPPPPNSTGGIPEIMVEITRRLEASGKKNFFEILEIDRKATQAEVKAAYFKLAKTFHPDRMRKQLSPDQQKMAEAYFAQITEAHTNLSNEESRKEYEATLELEASGLDAAKAQEILESEVEFQKGQVLIRKGDFAGAAKTLKHAIELYDQEPEYLVYLGWALYRNGKRTSNEVEVRSGKKYLEKAVAANDQFGQAFYFLGMVYRGEEDFDKAKRFFAKTLEVAPNHPEANSELRLLNMRAERKSGGALKGLFSKKK